MPDYPDWARPTTFQQTLIARNFIGGLPNLMDVSPYASVVIQMGALDQNSPLAAIYNFQAFDLSVLDQGLLTANTSTTGASWQLPVVGPWLHMAKTIAGTQIAAIYGSNVIAPGKRMLLDQLPARGFAATIPSGTPASTFTRLPGSPVDGSAVYADLSGFNGNCSFITRVFSTGGAAQWDFLPEFLNYDGTISRYVYASHTAATTQSFTNGHPRGFVRWNARNTTVLTSQAQVEVDVIPNALA